MDKFIAHILVVDDDDGIRSLVKKYLNENDFLVTTSDVKMFALKAPHKPLLEAMATINTFLTSLSWL